MPKKKSFKKLISKRILSSSKGGFSIMFFVLGAVVVVLIVAGYLLFNKPFTPNILTNSQIESYVMSSPVTIPDFDTEVKLSNGRGFPNAEGSGYVIVAEPYFSVKTDTGYDVFAVMEYNLGGSGVFTTVALFQVKNDTATFKGSYPIGDRVPVDEITGPIQSDSGTYEIVVSYKDRAENESMADAPTVLKTATIKISNHEISEN